MKSRIQGMLVAMGLLLSASVSAADIRAFDQATFEKLLATPEFGKIVVLKVNDDSQKDVRRMLGSSQQSTHIVGLLLGMVWAPCLGPVG